MSPIRKRKQDQNIVEMALRAYNYAVSYHATRKDQIRKSLHFLENVIYQVRLNPVERRMG